MAVSYQALQSMGFPGKNTGVGYHFLLQVILDQGIEHISSVSPALASRFFTTESPGKLLFSVIKGLYINISKYFSGYSF